MPVLEVAEVARDYLTRVRRLPSGAGIVRDAVAGLGLRRELIDACVERSATTGQQAASLQAISELLREAQDEALLYADLSHPQVDQLICLVIAEIDLHFSGHE